MFRFFLTVSLLLAPASAQVRFHPVAQDQILMRLGSAPHKNVDRQQKLVELFQSVGCKPELQPITHSKLSNVLCTLAGTSTDIIVVGGHFDKVDAGDGIVDDWSGASLLPTLYESLSAFPRRHTFIFIGFADEEVGLVGSRFYVKHMSPETAGHARMMINLECLGLNPTEVWASHSDKQLLSALEKVSGAMKIPVTAVNVEKVGTADSESFAAAKIPRTTIHSVDQNTLSILHSARDNLKAVHPDLYYDSYRLLAGYLAALDEWFDRSEQTKDTASQPSKGQAVVGSN